MCACQPPAAHTVKFRNERLRKCVCGRVTPVRGVKMYVWICPFRNVYTATPERRKVWLMDLKPLMCQDGCCSTSCPEIIIFLVCDGKKKKYIYIKLTSVLPLTLLSLSASKFNSILIIGGWPVIFKYSPVIISKASIQLYLFYYNLVLFCLLRRVALTANARDVRRVWLPVCCFDSCLTY